MVSSVTKVTDLQIPAMWDKYTSVDSVTLTNSLTNGLIVGDDKLNQYAGMEGVTFNAPFLNDLPDTEGEWDEANDIETQKVTSGKDIITKQGIYLAWADNDFADSVAGVDTLGMLRPRVAAAISRVIQRRVLTYMLPGVFGAASMAGNVYDITAAGTTKINAADFNIACKKLGDRSEVLTNVMMHSDVETELLNQDLIDFIPDSTGETSIPTYRGKVVSVNDAIPTADGVYNTYIYGNGAVRLGIGNPTRMVASEFNRDPKTGGGQEELIVRRSIITAIPGVKFTSNTVSGTEFPTAADLAVTANWEAVISTKLIPIVQFKHKLEQEKKK